MDRRNEVADSRTAVIQRAQELRALADEMRHLIEVLAVWWADHGPEYAEDDVDEAVGNHVDNQREAVERLYKFLALLSVSPALPKQEQ